MSLLYFKYNYCIFLIFLTNSFSFIHFIYFTFFLSYFLAHSCEYYSLNFSDFFFKEKRISGFNGATRNSGRYTDAFASIHVCGNGFTFFGNKKSFYFNALSTFLFFKSKNRKIILDKGKKMWYKEKQLTARSVSGVLKRAVRKSCPFLLQLKVVFY